MDTTRATRREWLGLAVLALPTLLLSLDVSVLYLALPHLSADLGADATQQLWILDIYSFLLAGFLVTMGTLGDRIGRRRLLLIGAVAFGLVSVLAATCAVVHSRSPEVLALPTVCESPMNSIRRWRCGRGAAATPCGSRKPPNTLGASWCSLADSSRTWCRPGPMPVTR